MESKVTIWDKYTHINTESKQVTDLKGIIIQLHGEIQMCHEALAYMAGIIDADKNKDKVEIITKPDIIF